MFEELSAAKVRRNMGMRFSLVTIDDIYLVVAAGGVPQAEGRHLRCGNCSLEPSV